MFLRDYPETEWIGHNAASADIPILEKIGINIPLEKVLDSIIFHYLVNCHLCKGTGKTTEEMDDKRGRGWMNLGSMLSIYTDLPYYKECRGEMCKPELPCPEHNEMYYNSLDAYGPAIALPKLKMQARLRGVDKLYPMHRELMYVLAQMREYGVKVDRPYVQQLNAEFEAEKKEILDTLPFNPDSPKQVVAYFKDKDVRLENAQEEAIREYIEDEGEENVPDELVLLLDYKELGNGTDRWFKPQYRDPKSGYLKGYLDEDDFIHPSVSIFTSSGRMMSSNPNCQNFSKRRRSRKQCECGHTKSEHAGPCTKCTCVSFHGVSMGKKVRRAIIAPDGWYLIRADLSNAEGRTVMWHAGYKELPQDMHSWMVKNIGLTEEEPFSLSMGGAREAAKTAVHSSNYLEGLQLKTPEELRSPRMKKEIEAGARTVFWDWTFRKKIVCLTGVNMARRAFGDASFENRRRALDVVRRYIDEAFPKVREFHKMVARQVEQENAVRPLHGYCLVSYAATPEDQLKTAVAVWGQQTTAHLNKLAILSVQKEFKQGRPMRAILPVHDELVCYCKKEVPPQEAAIWLKGSMEPVLPEMPGLNIPAEPSYGYTEPSNWRDTKRI